MKTLKRPQDYPVQRLRFRNLEEYGWAKDACDRWAREQGVNPRRAWSAFVKELIRAWLRGREEK